MCSEEDYDVLGLSRRYHEAGECLAHRGVVAFQSSFISEPVKKSQKSSSKPSLK